MKRSVPADRVFVGIEHREVRLERQFLGHDRKRVIGKAIAHRQHCQAIVAGGLRHRDRSRLRNLEQPMVVSHGHAIGRDHLRRTIFARGRMQRPAAIDLRAQRGKRRFECADVLALERHEQVQRGSHGPVGARPVEPIRIEGA